MLAVHALMKRARSSSTSSTTTTSIITATKVCQHLPQYLPKSYGIPISGWKVETTPDERLLFQTVRDTCLQYSLQTVPRVAGGWVRDKLLGRDCADIDIAVDNCSGEEFAARVNSHLISRGHEAKSVGVIKANPDQSKHLATAAMRVHGIQVDFVQLRMEQYYADSRIPLAVQAGTPLNDAERRDFTVNSMFYNILTSSVEDLTGKGILDLANGLLRTPLPASQTFAEDPLRMLRGIRFASRYGFSLHPSVCEALCDANNIAALQAKISCERVGHELVQSLQTSRPEWAIDLVLKHGLMDAIFKIPEECILNNAKIKPQMNWERGAKLAKAMIASSTLEHDVVCCCLAALLLPLKNMETKHQRKKDKFDSSVHFVVADSLKLSHKLADLTSKVVAAASFFEPLLKSHLDEANEHEIRLQTGRMIHKVEDSWIAGLELATLDCEMNSAVSTFRTNAKELKDKIQGSWDLDKVHLRIKQNSVLDGRGVMKLLGIKGPDVSVALDLVKDFSFLHAPPNNNNTAEYVNKAKEWLVEKWKATSS